MRDRMGKWIFWLMAAAGMTISGASFAAHINLHQRVDGMDVYYGVVPSSIVTARPAGHAEATMHGDVEPGSYHLVVSLIDSRSGRPITDAKVSALVGSRFFSRGEERTLKPMRINNTISFGNYFALSRPGTYQIHFFSKGRRSGTSRRQTFPTGSHERST